MADPSLAVQLGSANPARAINPHAEDAAARGEDLGGPGRAAVPPMDRPIRWTDPPLVGGRVQSLALW
jgi:hypothetical protein